MEQEVEQYRDVCLALCNSLLVGFEENQEDTERFFGGELKKTYVTVNEKVAGKIRQIRSKIKSL